jgi:hypothetical protein
VLRAAKGLKLMTKRKTPTTSRAGAIPVPAPTQPEQLFSLISAHRIVNTKTREQYFAWSRSEAMQVLTTTLKDWSNYTIEEGMFPEFLVY